MTVAAGSAEVPVASNPVRFRIEEVAAATRGSVSGPACEIDGAAIDSRVLAAHQLFVPIVAGRDGHLFIPAALDAGAAAYLTEKEPLAPDHTAVVVENTSAALLELGKMARDRLPERVVGITGSVGKTSTKDLLAAALVTTYATTANERSFNNELGLPLTLCNAPDGAEAVVVEMGARGVGHIAQLCGIARPVVGVVTRVDGVHLEFFGDLETVARSKAELVESLPQDGVAVLNADQQAVAEMAKLTRAGVLHFGRDPRSDVSAEHIVLDHQLRPRFLLRSPWGSAEVQLAVRGEHQVANALAAAGAALALGVPPEAVADGLASASASAARMHLERAPSGALVLNDAYNANPTSVAAALNALAALPAARRVAVLGVMAELGDGGPAAHEDAAKQALALGIRVVAVGAPAYGPDVEHVPDIDAALVVLGRLEEGDAVLVKGSRVAALERLAEALLAA